MFCSNSFISLASPNLLPILSPHCFVYCWLIYLFVYYFLACLFLYPKSLNVTCPSILGLLCGLSLECGQFSIDHTPEKKKKRLIFLHSASLIAIVPWLRLGHSAHLSSPFGNLVWLELTQTWNVLSQPLWVHRISAILCSENTVSCSHPLPLALISFLLLFHNKFWALGEGSVI